MKQQTEWFENWFDTPYYHLLYDYRNDREAEYFMGNLVRKLQLEPGDPILDLPCGKGRHARYLNSLGFQVVGADISENSIAHARHFENSSLRFTRHDMRDPLSGTYRAIFNLFTSFGYFEQEETNTRVLRNFKKALRDDGRLVIDFLNLERVRQQLVSQEEFIKKGVRYSISKKITERFIIKDIRVNDRGEIFDYQEKVQALDLDKFRRHADMAGLNILNIYGDYDLNSFDDSSSDRLILIMK